MPAATIVPCKITKKVMPTYAAFFNAFDPRHECEAQKSSLLGAFFLSDIWALALQHLMPVCVPNKLGQHLCFGEPKQLILAVHFGTLAAECFHRAVVL
jgi:hypothetical protein